MIREKFLIKIVAFFLCSATTALVWDGWWHVAVGRETFWEPPHLLLYISVMVAVGASAYEWYVRRERVWKRIALVALAIPLSAPFDDAWHRFFGVENLNTVLIVWSPPHLVLFGALIASMVMVLPLLKKEPEKTQWIFDSYIFAAILAVLMGIAAPLFPFAPYHLLGFWGAGFISAVIVGTLLAASKWIGNYGASMTALFLVALYFLYSAAKPGGIVQIPPYQAEPPFATFFYSVVPGIFIDTMRKQNRIVLGTVGGLLHGVVLYGVTSQFLQPQFQYGTGDMLAAILSSVIGGALAGLIVNRFCKNHGQG